MSKKPLIVGIASKFIHTMPSVWFLSESCRTYEVEIEELYLNINAPYSILLDSIMQKNTDTFLFSVYIFNVAIVTRLICDLKLINPFCKIIIGGPEFLDIPEIDYIIIGEGEQVLPCLLKSFFDKTNHIGQCDSLNLQSYPRIIKTSKIYDLNTIANPYTTERLFQHKGKILYYESSRGCKFHCTYCMASLDNDLRYFDLNRVFSDLKNIVANDYKIIKFTDRTFNFDTSRTLSIFNFLLNNFYDFDGSFHFEVNAELFNADILTLISKFPKGLIQFEIGIQTLNPDTQKAIKRPYNKNLFLKNLAVLQTSSNVHLHVDLIAGLPKEDIDSFKNSFNEVIFLLPHQLQLGFLKYLKGTAIKENFDATFSEFPPYEVLRTNKLSYYDISKIKTVETILEKLYNSGKFDTTMNFLFKIDSDIFSLFLKFGRYLSQRHSIVFLSENNLIHSLFCFINEEYSLIAEKLINCIRIDYLSTNNTKILPTCLKIPYTNAYYKLLKAYPTTKTQFLYEIIENNKSLFYLFDYTLQDKISGKYSLKQIDFSPSDLDNSH